METTFKTESQINSEFEKDYWQAIGWQYNNTDYKKDRFKQAIADMEWFDAQQKNDLPFMQGEAIKNMIKAIGHNVSRYGHGIFSDGQAIIAIENNYLNGDVTKVIVYGIDDGMVTVTPVLAHEFHNPKI